MCSAMNWATEIAISRSSAADDAQGVLTSHLGPVPPCSTGPGLPQELLTEAYAWRCGERKEGPLQLPSSQSITVTPACPSHPSSSWISPAVVRPGHSNTSQPQNPVPGPAAGKSQGQNLPSADTENTSRPWPPCLPPGISLLAWLGCLASLSSFQLPLSKRGGIPCSSRPDLPFSQWFVLHSSMGV